MNTPCQSKRPVAGGFSCDHIGQGTGRSALHVAGVIRHAMEADA